MAGCGSGGGGDGKPESIAMVAAGSSHTVGLKSDGTVVALGFNGDGQCDVGRWTDITQVAAGYWHTVGLKTDGTVVATGYWQPDVGNWTNIIQVAAGWYNTVGLKNDGTVVALGQNWDGQCYVGGWTDTVQVAAGWYHTVGLTTDGTAVTVGENEDKQCEVGSWTDITQVAAGFSHTVGLTTDGTVVATGLEVELARWNLVLALPPQRVLFISSTAGGSVITPGEGTFTYAPGTVVNVVAKPDEGYRFVDWTRDVDTIGDVNVAATNITMDDHYCVTASFATDDAGDVGIKAGDWIKKVTPWLWTLAKAVARLLDFLDLSSPLT